MTSLVLDETHDFLWPRCAWVHTQYKYPAKKKREYISSTYRINTQEIPIPSTYLIRIRHQFWSIQSLEPKTHIDANSILIAPHPKTEKEHANYISTQIFEQCGSKPGECLSPTPPPPNTRNEKEVIHDREIKNAGFGTSLLYESVT